MVQEPRVVLRVPYSLYLEVVAIAEARDCTYQQAFDLWVRRQVQKGVEDAGRKEPEAKDGAGGSEARKPRKRTQRAQKPADEWAEFFGK